MTLFHRQFDILRIMITPTDDDQVFESASNEEFSTLEKSQISSAQKRTLTRIRKICLEGTFRLLRPVPVAIGDCTTGYPNFPYLVRWELNQRFGMDNDNVLVTQGRATADEGNTIRISRGALDYLIAL